MKLTFPSTLARSVTKLIAFATCSSVVWIGVASPVINMCLEAQYNGDGESIDVSKCWYLESQCGGNCYKYVTSSDTSTCEHCVSSGLAFWKECDPIGTVTSLSGTRYSSTCTTKLMSCGCDEDNWVLDSVTTVPCYHATGDSC